MPNLEDTEQKQQPLAMPVILSPPVACGNSFTYEETTESPLPALFQDPVPPPITNNRRFYRPIPVAF